MSGPAWMAQAACRDLAFADHDPWHPAGTAETAEMYQLARRVCAGCPVQAECREYGLRIAARHGVQGMWAGLTPEQMRRLVKQRRARRAA